MEFYEKLQRLRTERHLTQEQLATQLYVSRTAVSKWESGRGLPNLESLKAISRLFSVPIDTLLSDEAGSPGPQPPPAIRCLGLHSPSDPLPSPVFPAGGPSCPGCFSCLRSDSLPCPVRPSHCSAPGSGSVRDTTATPPPQRRLAPSPNLDAPRRDCAPLRPYPPALRHRTAVSAPAGQAVSGTPSCL